MTNGYSKEEIIEEICKNTVIQRLCIKMGIKLDSQLISSIFKDDTAFKKQEYYGSDISSFSQKILIYLNNVNKKKPKELTEKELKCVRGVADIILPEFRWGKKISEISFITLLRFLPEFNNAVDKIRIEKKIDFEKTKNELRQSFNGVEADNYISYITEANPSFFTVFLRKEILTLKTEKQKNKRFDEIASIMDRIKDWEKKRFPDIKSYLNAWRLRDLKFLHRDFLYDFKNYILYNSPGCKPLSQIKNKPPEIAVMIGKKSYLSLLKNSVSKEIFEPHIIIKVYKDTPKNKIEEALDDWQDILPEHNVGRGALQKANAKSLLGKLIFFQLERDGLKPKEANNFIAGIGFKKISTRRIDTEKKRIERLFRTKL